MPSPAESRVVRLIGLVLFLVVYVAMALAAGDCAVDCGSGVTQGCGAGAPPGPRAQRCQCTGTIRHRS